MGICLLHLDAFHGRVLNVHSIWRKCLAVRVNGKPPCIPRMQSSGLQDDLPGTYKTLRRVIGLRLRFMHTSATWHLRPLLITMCDSPLSESISAVIFIPLSRQTTHSDNFLWRTRPFLSRICKILRFIWDIHFDWRRRGPIVPITAVCDDQ